ncbi:hypothetical protein ACJQWK_01236 [Exserohilum turcicum]
MGNAATREIALRFVIAWVIISKMQLSKDSSKSFLPAEIARCYEAIIGEQQEHHDPPLVTKWRVITAGLMNSNYAHTAIDVSDSRYASIQASLVMLDRVLQPYADLRMKNEERKRNLEEVLKRSASFAYTLFSQPSTWKFEWQKGQGVTSGELCVFPALVQVADETGQQINPPRPFSEAIVRRLDT